ncbi:galactokinase [Ruminococcaceae bacterium OttesenSCG-928-L11]|nr:galactokinase [Ruminococcaceae bacterium OttesenSCG-928-L11]
MQESQVLTDAFLTGAYDNTFRYLYAAKADLQRERYTSLLTGFTGQFGDKPVRLFSAPGRTEVGGNHTDHQHGRVLAAAVNLDIICAAAPNDDGVIRIHSEGYPMDTVELSDLAKKESEDNKAISLIRGICARMREKGYTVSGFDAYTTSNVLKGSGLSSSAAFEVAIGTMISYLFNDGAVSPVEIAQISQYAENVYFGKPSGLMDQMASSVGGFITIDFADTDHPVIEPIAFDFASCGHSLCIVDTKGDHADLTGEYAAIPADMKKICDVFGVSYLRQVDEAAFYSRLAELRKTCGDRAVLRAIHFFGDNGRVVHQADALNQGRFDRFKELIIESGRSSFACLQNVFACSDPEAQGLSLALALSEDILAGKGAWRVHGGGFAGTIQAFVPTDLLDAYRTKIESVFGDGSCYVLSIRPTGGVEITPELGQ